jgi:hypothetical protein
MNTMPVNEWGSLTCGGTYFKRLSNGEETYKWLDEYLKAGRDKNFRKWKSRNTAIVRLDDRIFVKLHNTEVIGFSKDGSIILNSGGYRTVTTKARINEFLPKGYRLTQDKSIWYVHKIFNDEYPGKFSPAVVFYDFMALPNAFDDPKKSDKEKKRILSLQKKIDKYLKKLGKMIDNFDLEEPGPGDCWICCIKEMSDSDQSHLMSHLDEGYVVPTLVFNAMTDMGLNALVVWQTYYQAKQLGEDKYHWRSMYKDRMVAATRRYLKRKLGIAR